MKTCKSCGILLADTTKAQTKEKRCICKWCYAREKKENYAFKKDIYNAKRREHRKMPKEKRNCVICSKEFETARELQKTCLSDECKTEYYRIAKRLYYKKNIKVYA